MSRGKLIVIDGTNGSGKTVQTDLLVERMRTEGMPAGTVSYPMYETPTGKAVRAYLNGEFGPTTGVPAKQASMLYAVDRWASFRRGDFDGLERGQHMVSNRYVTANMGHQGALIRDPEERKAFFRWNDDLEHGFFGIPRPDINVILHVPAEVSMRLLVERGNALDGHENLEHQRAAMATYLELARTLPGYVLIECMDGERLRSPEEIHGLIWTETAKVLALQTA